MTPFKVDDESHNMHTSAPARHSAHQSRSTSVPPARVCSASATLFSAANSVNGSGRAMSAEQCGSLRSQGGEWIPFLTVLSTVPVAILSLKARENRFMQTSAMVLGLMGVLSPKMRAHQWRRISNSLCYDFRSHGRHTMTSDIYAYDETMSPSTNLSLAC